MNQAKRVDILLIWVNAERQFEREFLDVLDAHPDFERPKIVDRDAHQAEISATFPAETDILEAVIDSLIELPDYGIDIQGAEKERHPTVVFSAVPLRGRPKPNRARDIRRHIDTGQQSKPAARPTSERVLSTSEMAETSGPQPDIVRRGPPRHESSLQGPERPATRRPKRQVRYGHEPRPGLVPLIKKIAKVLLTEEEPAERYEESPKKPDKHSKE